MNKAFTREPDASSDYCPRCGTQGETVGIETLQSFLSDEQRRMLSVPANFCPSPSCDVVYFDSFERALLAADLAKPVYPKDPNAPLCGCLGLTWDDIEADAIKGDRSRVKAAIELAKSPSARCHVTMASGHACVGLVQKCFLQSMNRGGTG